MEYLGDHPAKVALIKQDRYHAGLKKDIHRLIDLLDGPETFFHTGDRVLVKPNLLRANPMNDCTCTDPAVTMAVCALLLDYGCQVSVGDSPMFGSAASVAASLGLDEGLRRLGVPLIEFTRNVPLRHPEDLPNRKYPSLVLAKEVDDFDGLVNLPKLKTHVQTGLTLAVKNLYGCIAGEKKKLYHLTCGDQRSFSRLLLETAYSLRPRLNILDGIRGMDLNGPAAGRPRDIGILAASSDPLSLDRVVLEVTGISPKKIGIFREAPNLFPGESWWESAEVVGIPVTDWQIKKFKAVHLWPVDFAGFHFLYKPLIRLFGKRIIVDRRRCALCRRCEQLCPAEAISVKNHKISVDHHRCIRCCCCAEACPRHAIKLRWL